MKKWWKKTQAWILEKLGADNEEPEPEGPDVGLIFGKPRAWTFYGIPYPTETNPQLDALGYTAWAYDPCLLSLPAQPSPWTSDQAGYYYVDFQNGTDSGRTYGNPTAPRKTIPRPVSAGSYVFVTDTYDYNQAGVVWVEGNGTSATWSANSAGPVFITGDGILNSTTKCIIYGDHIIVDGSLGLTCNYSVQIASVSAGYDSTHITVRHTNIDMQNADVGAMSVNAETASDHFMIYNNTIKNAGSVEDVTDTDRHGINIVGPTNYTWVINNVIHETSGAGLQVIGGNAADGIKCDGVYVAGNDCYHNRQSGLWVKYGENCIFSQNKVRNVVDTSWSVSKGIGAQYEPVSLWILFNDIYTEDENVNVGPNDGDGIKYGVRVPSTNASPPDLYVYVIGNVIRNTVGDHGGTDFWDPCAIHFVGAQYRYIINNTIDNCSSGIQLASTTGTTHIYNNIVSNITDAQGYHLMMQGTANYQSDYNLFYDPSSYRWRESGTTETAIANWRTTTSEDANSTTGDPLFNADYTVQAGSPAINNGVDPSSLPTDVYALFQSTYGLSIDVDKAGGSRTQTVTDIGAHEKA